MEHVEPLEIAADHAAYAGHFPGAPILPGAVLLDAALQALAPHAAAGGAWRIETAKFFAVVRPGDRLEIVHARVGPARLRFTIRGTDGAARAAGLISHADGP